MELAIIMYLCEKHVHARFIRLVYFSHYGVWNSLLSCTCVKKMFMLVSYCIFLFLNNKYTNLFLYLRG